jgi:metal-dependent amidase/aminoacylase/carboxypeptidase family protein
VKFEERSYLNVIHNTALVKAFDKNIKSTEFFQALPASEFPAGGSTDMGNVSYLVPSIHPMFYIGSDALNHTREFTVATGISETNLQFYVKY